MVYEEKFITKYNVPALQAVGWEGKIDLFVQGYVEHAFLLGTFGFTTLALLLIPFSFIQVCSLFIYFIISNCTNRSGHNLATGLGMCLRTPMMAATSSRTTPCLPLPSPAPSSPSPSSTLLGSALPRSCRQPPGWCSIASGPW